LKLFNPFALATSNEKEERGGVENQEKGKGERRKKKKKNTLANFFPLHSFLQPERGGM